MRTRVWPPNYAAAHGEPSKSPGGGRVLRVGTTAATMSAALQGAYTTVVSSAGTAATQRACVSVQRTGAG
jgi:hypothetical protein